MNRFNELTMPDVGVGRGSSLAAPVTSLNLDVHQHLWPERMLEALRARDKPPMLRGWTLELEGESPYEVDPSHHDPETRRSQALEQGLDLALISQIGRASCRERVEISVVAVALKEQKVTKRRVGGW